VLPTLSRTSVSGDYFVGKFYKTRSLTNIMVQGRMWGNWCCPDSVGGHFANGDGWDEGC
jgi:hypothetical protein